MANLNNNIVNPTNTTSAEEIRAMSTGKIFEYVKDQFSNAGLPIPQELSGVLNPPTPEAPAPTPAPEENPVTYGVPTPQMLNNIWGCAPTPTTAPPQVSSAAELQLRFQQQQQMQHQMALQEQMQQQMLQMQQQMELQQQQLAALQCRERAAKIAAIDVEAELKKRIKDNPGAVDFVKKFADAIKVIAEAGGDPTNITTSDDAATAVIAMAKAAMKTAIKMAAERGIPASQLKGWLYKVAQQNKVNDMMILDKLWEFLTK